MPPIALEFALFALIFVMALGLALALIVLGSAVTVWSIARGYVQIQTTQAVSRPQIIPSSTGPNPGDDRSLVPIETRRSRHAL